MNAAAAKKKPKTSLWHVRVVALKSLKHSHEPDNPQLEEDRRCHGSSAHAPQGQGVLNHLQSLVVHGMSL